MKSIAIVGMVVYLISVPSFAREVANSDRTNTTSYKVGEAFQIQAKITNYYGREKSAEAAMWSNALKVCEDLDDKPAVLLLNRISEITFKTFNTVSSATATFICVPIGQGD